jgi:hypothetical protein
MGEQPYARVAAGDSRSSSSTGLIAAKSLWKDHVHSDRDRYHQYMVVFVHSVTGIEEMGTWERH